VHALGVERERAALQDLACRLGPAQRVNPAKQRVHARGEVGEAQILGEEVVRSQPQSRHGIELAVACGEEDDRQLGRQSPQLTAQLESAFRLVRERDVDDGEVGQPCGAGRHGLRAIGVTAYCIAFAREGGGVVVTDGRFVLDDGDQTLHTARLQAASVP